MTQLNVCIVGGNIIGSYLAFKLKKRGNLVTVFEKNAFIGQKPCSGLVSERIFNFLPEVKNFFIRKVDFLIVHFNKKDIKINFNPSQYLFERKKLDEFCANRAQELGVKFIFDKNIKEIPKNFDRIIGCDGALSKIREFIKIPLPSFQLGIKYLREEKNNNLTIEVWPSKNGFLWRIPFEEKSEYGALGDCKFILNEFKNFLERKKIDFEENRLKLALVPSKISLPKEKNITLCGDSAGMTSPLSGGGIIWGLTAADILIENFPDFLNYRKKTYRFFKKKEKRANFLKNCSRLFLTKYKLGIINYFLPKELIIDPNLFVPFWRYQINY